MISKTIKFQMIPMIFSYRNSLFIRLILSRQNTKITEKDFRSPCITRGIKKSSEHKQRLYVKFLKLGIMKMRLNAETMKTYLSR